MLATKSPLEVQEPNSLSNEDMAFQLYRKGRERTLTPGPAILCSTQHSCKYPLHIHTNTAELKNNNMKNQNKYALYSTADNNSKIQHLKNWFDSLKTAYHQRTGLSACLHSFIINMKVVQFMQRLTFLTITTWSQHVVYFIFDLYSCVKVIIPFLFLELSNQLDSK